MPKQTREDITKFDREDFIRDPTQYRRDPTKPTFKELGPDWGSFRVFNEEAWTRVGPRLSEEEKGRRKGSLERRKRQLKGKGGRAGTVLTGKARKAEDIGAASADTILTSLRKQTSLLGR